MTKSPAYILIADSGSTKTDWCLTDGQQHRHILTQGINPYQQNEEEIQRIIFTELLPALSAPECPHLSEVDSLNLYFYGAGCTPEKCETVASALRKGTAESSVYLHEVHVNSDLLGAARALFANTAGIACILGTGSNSCYYDGNIIRENVSPLGFILGDEGSGASLGKQLVGNCLKRQFPQTICQAFAEECGITPERIIQQVYREPMPNRFLAGFAPFLHRHRAEAAIHTFLVDEFTRFFTRNVALYHRPELAVSFVGSIAHFFCEELKEAAHQCGFRIGMICRTPADGLLRYHLKKPYSGI